MTLAPALDLSLSAATRAQHIGRARRKAQRIVILVASAPLIHGALPNDLAAQDWGCALDPGQCALWLLEHDVQFLAMPSVDLALEWLYYVGSADHGMWPEQGMIPYPAGELARMAEA